MNHYRHYEHTLHTVPLETLAPSHHLKTCMLKLIGDQGMTYVFACAL